MGIINFILDFIYPRKCIVCGDILTLENKNNFCKECEKCLQYLNEDCNNEFFNKHNVYVKRNYGVFVYNEYMRDIIHRFKYKNHPEYGRILSELMTNKLDDIINRHNIDVIIPIPLHKKRYKERGYNQSEILAKNLSKKINFQIDSKSLCRVRLTKPQNNLNANMRKNNLKNAFDFVDIENVSYKKILLIDDVYTTGSTVEAAACVLSAHGSEVYSLCLAVAVK